MELSLNLLNRISFDIENMFANYFLAEKILFFLFFSQIILL
jgi:hypothetical protein